MIFTHVFAMIIALSAVASDVAEPPKPPQVTDEVRIAQAYLLPNCPISNKAVGSMDAAATRSIDGRSVMVCCPPCFERYERTPEKYKDKIDRQVTEAQLATYPLTTCLASGRPIDVKGTPTNAVYGNRLMRFCCGGCANYVIKDPTRLSNAMKTLDTAVIAKQGPTYTSKTCPISGEELGDDAVDVVVGGSMIRVCCDSCRNKIVRSPRMVVDLVVGCGTQQTDETKDDPQI